MKSIFLLCEYGISVSTANALHRMNITIDKIINDNHCLDRFFGEYGVKKNQIIKIIENGIKENSVYNLIEYGLSLAIVEKLKGFNLTLEDLNENIIDKYDIGKSTFTKIMNAYHFYCAANGIKKELSEDVLYKYISDNYKNENFTEDEIELKLREYSYSCEKLNELLQNLIEDNKLVKSGNGYFIKQNIYVLEFYGLSKSIIDFLYENDVELDDINIDLKAELNISDIKYQKIIDAYSKFIENNNYQTGVTYRDLYKFIENNYNYDKFSIHELLDKLEEKEFYVTNVNKLLTKLVDKNKLDIENDLYYIKYPKLIDELNKITNEKSHYDIVMKKLSGKTLAEIGREYDVTRERIRQVFSKEINKFPKVEEDQYAEYIKKYEINYELFNELFKKEKYVYQYLKEKNGSGDLDVSGLLNDDKLSEEQKEIIRKRCNLIRYKGEYIGADRNSILVAYLKNAERQVDYEEIIENYNLILREHNLDLGLITKDDIRNIDAILSRMDCILSTLGKTYRYYDCNNIEEEEKEELKRILNTTPGVYSSEFFFNSNPLLMKKLDIRNEYELHNLLRKVLGDFDKNIFYSRMPDIHIYFADKEEFVESQIQEMSPISVDDFAEYMYQNYGHKINTLKAYLTANFDTYINIDMLVSDSPEFNAEQFEIMKNILEEDIYATSTIKEILTEKFNVDDFSLLNNMNFSKLGYKVRGNYIMRNTINSLEPYLKNIILSSDYYEIPEEFKKIGSTFSSYLSKFIYDKKLFKIEDDKYITIKKLNSMGITENDIDDFINKISESILENEYFNLYTLNTNFSNKLLEYDFQECFYETIIMILPNVKTFRIKNNTMFIKTDETASREKFINSFIVKEKTYIYEIKNQIKEKYNVELPEYYIKEFINKNKFYLQSNTGCVYLNKEIYENEINKWDILQYID